MLAPVIRIAHYVLKIAENIFCHGLFRSRVPTEGVQNNFYFRCWRRILSVGDLGAGRDDNDQGYKQ